MASSSNSTNGAPNVPPVPPPAPNVAQQPHTIDLVPLETAQPSDDVYDVLASVETEPSLITAVNNARGTGPERVGRPDHRAKLGHDRLLNVKARENREIWLAMFPFWYSRSAASGQGARFKIRCTLKLHGPINHKTAPAQELTFTHKVRTIEDLHQEIHLRLDKVVLELGFYDAELIVNGLPVANFPAQIRVKHARHDGQKSRKGRGTRAQDNRGPSNLKRSSRPKSKTNRRPRRARASLSVSPFPSSGYDSSTSAEMPLAGAGAAVSTSSSSASLVSSSASSQVHNMAYGIFPQLAPPSTMSLTQQGNAAALGPGSAMGTPVSTPPMDPSTPLPFLTEQQLSQIWPGHAGVVSAAPIPTIAAAPAPNVIPLASAAQPGVSDWSLAMSPPFYGFQQGGPAPIGAMQISANAPQSPFTAMPNNLLFAGVQWQAPLPMALNTVPLPAGPGPVPFYWPINAQPAALQVPLAQLEPAQVPASAATTVSGSSSPVPSLESFYSVPEYWPSVPTPQGHTPPLPPTYLMPPSPSLAELFEDTLNLDGEPLAIDSMDAQDDDNGANGSADADDDLMAFLLHQD